MQIFLSLWTFAMFFCWSSVFPRPFDDCKNLIFTLGTAVLFFVQLWRTRKTCELQLAPLVFGILYLIAMCVSLSSPYAAIYDGLWSITRMILWFALMWAVASLPSVEQKSLLRSVVLAAAAAALASFVGYYFFQQKWFYQGSYIAPIGNATYFADALAMAIPLAALVGYFSHKPREKYFSAILGVLLLAAVWFSGTRSSLLGLFSAGILLAVYFKVKEQVQSSVIMRFFVGIVVLLCVFHFFLPSFRAVNTTERLAPLGGMRIFSNIEQIEPVRLKGYANSLNMISLQPWFGWGAGSFRLVYSGFAPDRWYMHPHNEELHQAVELGIVGLSIFLAFFVWLTRLAYFYLRGAQKNARKELVFLFAVLVVELVSWQFSTNFLFPLSRFLVAISVGILFANFSRNLTTKKIQLRLAGKTTFGMLVFVAVMVHLASAWSLMLVQDTFLRSPEEQAAMLEKAYHLAPGSFEILFPLVDVELATGNEQMAWNLSHVSVQNFPLVTEVLLRHADLAAAHGDFETADRLRTKAQEIRSQY